MPIMYTYATDTRPLAELAAQLEEAEDRRLSPLACSSRDGIRRQREHHDGYRPCFSQDADRILHSHAYSRYADKTQVFSLVDNDHISHRVLHVQIVSRIGRTIGRFLGLNEDLIEAIALGHDTGHPPFGHEGERILSRIVQAHGLDGFLHNVQSVQFLDRFERGGKGWNLSLQVLDGILCHDGETHAQGLRPERVRNFTAFDRLLAAKQSQPSLPLAPMTLEGCVVRLADVIAYIGRDIEDAIELKLVRRADLPQSCCALLGNSNGTIVHTLVTDVISTSHRVRSPTGPDDDQVGFSAPVAEALLVLKRFNYDHIYRAPAFRPDYQRIHRCYEALFDHYLDRLGSRTNDRTFLRSMGSEYLESHTPAMIVRDYLAGMTDAYFLRKAAAIGCELPARTCLPN